MKKEKVENNKKNTLFSFFIFKINLHNFSHNHHLLYISTTSFYNLFMKKLISFSRNHNPSYSSNLVFSDFH